MLTLDKLIRPKYISFKLAVASQADLFFTTFFLYLAKKKIFHKKINRGTHQKVIVVVKVSELGFFAAA